MSFRDEFKIFTTVKILQWTAVMLMVLFPNLRGKLNITVTGVVYLSFTNFVSDACLIMRSRISMLYGLGLVKELAIELMDSSSRSSSDRYMV